MRITLTAVRLDCELLRRIPQRGMRGGAGVPAIGHALALAGSMTWEILWALILGFAVSAVVQAVVRKSTIVGLLGDDRPRTLAIAAGLGAASSCSYAAFALARALIRKGANFIAAMAFEIGFTRDTRGPALGMMRIFIVPSAVAAGAVSA